MITGRKDLLSWFDTQTGKPYFSIFRKQEAQSGNYVFTNKDKENESMETARAYLDSCLALLSTGEFFIYCHEKQVPSSKGRSETFFSVSMNERQAAPQAQVAAVQGLSADDVNRLAEEKFTQLMISKELADLKTKAAALEKENKELTKKMQLPWNQVLQGLSPYIGPIVEGFGIKPRIGTQPPVSGVKHDENLHDNELSEEEVSAAQAKAETAVKNFCQALSEKYPDNWMDILNKLTDALNNSPEKIDLALKFL